MQPGSWGRESLRGMQRRTVYGAGKKKGTEEHDFMYGLLSDEYGGIYECQQLDYAEQMKES